MLTIIYNKLPTLIAKTGCVYGESLADYQEGKRLVIKVPEYCKTNEEQMGFMREFAKKYNKKMHVIIYTFSGSIIAGVCASVENKLISNEQIEICFGDVLIRITPDGKLDNAPLRFIESVVVKDKNFYQEEKLNGK